MATTTNFGWVTPDDTSLVKDGAAAIRTLGQAIDTSMMDLEGGTTGQVLSKASNTDMDFAWVAAGATPTFVGCFVYGTANQTISNATVTTIPFGAENFDSDGFHNNSTNNSRITIPTGKGGKYLVVAQSSFAANVTGFRQTRILKNGTAIDLTNATLTAQCRDKSSNAVLFSFVCTVTAPATNGAFSLSLGASTSATLTAQKNAIKRENKVVEPKEEDLMAQDLIPSTLEEDIEALKDWINDLCRQKTDLIRELDEAHNEIKTAMKWIEELRLSEETWRNMYNDVLEELTEMKDNHNAIVKDIMDTPRLICTSEDNEPASKTYYFLGIPLWSIKFK